LPAATDFAFAVAVGTVQSGGVAAAALQNTPAAVAAAVGGASASNSPATTAARQAGSTQSGRRPTSFDPTTDVEDLLGLLV
jgi:hypothetical protein